MSEAAATKPAIHRPKKPTRQLTPSSKWGLDIQGLLHHSRIQVPMPCTELVGLVQAEPAYQASHEATVWIRKNPTLPTMLVQVPSSIYSLLSLTGPVLRR
mmetsp:Transcript_121640/g.295210  ORF Transcript_121640/g.295210 Transcript_121640/m.295210 type:complete len:100 (+) Transcript_121640:873-1172(+)